MAIGLTLLCSAGFLALQRESEPTSWVTAWSTSQSGLGRTMINNATVRMIARVSLPGEAVRIRLDNTFSTSPLRIGRAFVGHRVRNAYHRFCLSFRGAEDLLARGVQLPFGGAIHRVFPALALSTGVYVAISAAGGTSDDERVSRCSSCGRRASRGSSRSTNTHLSPGSRGVFTPRLPALSHHSFHEPQAAPAQTALLLQIWARHPRSGCWPAVPDGIEVLVDGRGRPGRVVGDSTSVTTTRYDRSRCRSG